VRLAGNRGIDLIMRDPGNNHLKAWSREYEEKPFCFQQDSEHGKRLVAWTEESGQIKNAFYSLLENFPDTVDILLKISAGESPEGRPLWSRYQGEISLWQLVKSVQENEIYVFSDGMHQLCVKDPDSGHYLAFDDHGIFFVYEPMLQDAEVFWSLGFENRYAEPIYVLPHFQHLVADSERLELRFVSDLQLQKVKSDLE
jgi:hypothetical protein